MATNPRFTWQPDWAVAPGEILLEALQERGMTQSELAQRLGRPLKTVNEIVKGKAAITSETAIQLERALGISARMWTSLETQYRDALAREDATRQLADQATWADLFPIADLVKRGLLERGRSKGETLANLLSFLGVSSPSAFEKLEASASYRASPAYIASPMAVRSWLRWGELVASEIPSPPYDARKFQTALQEIRRLSRLEPFDQVLKRVKELCATAGVIVVLIPELSGTHLSGATRWIGSRAIIQLSLRYRSDDQFWFTFFHEAGHVLAGSRRSEYIDSADVTEHEQNAHETAADQFARDTLLPRDEYQAFVDAHDFSRSAVRTFASDQQLAPGIVVGRLQRDGHLPSSGLNDLKRSITLRSDRQ